MKASQYQIRYTVFAVYQWRKLLRLSNSGATNVVENFPCRCRVLFRLLNRNEFKSANELWPLSFVMEGDLNRLWQLRLCRHDAATRTSLILRSVPRLKRGQKCWLFFFKMFDHFQGSSCNNIFLKFKNQMIFMWLLKEGYNSISSQTVSRNCVIFADWRLKLQPNVF